MSLTIVAPRASGLAENQSYLPGVVQREFVDNFSGYSAISVLNYESLGEQYDVLLSGYFDDNAGGDLGHLPETTHMMRGNITRTATGYALQMQITKTADKMITASYSGDFTFAELDNRTGIRRASLDLLQKMGVTLTAQAREGLTKAAAANHVTAQTALAQGVAAQRQGTEFAALSYYFQAAAYDPSLHEAVSRSSILSANISSGNIGQDARNDVAWRRDWIARLTETEQYFANFNRTESMPYTLFYVSDEIKQEGEINYRNETVTMKIETHLHGSGIWTLSIERALQAVYDGLNATGRKNVWELGGWPQQGVTNLNAFARRSGNFSVVFELLNSQNKVIGRQTLQSGGSWGLNWGGRPEVQVSADDRKTLYFQNVNVNDITDSLTIRVATVNGTAAETAAQNGVLQIRAVTRNEFDANARFQYARGEIQGLNERVANLVIPDTIWGDPVISIREGAFQNAGLTSLTIPNIFTSISARAFSDNQLRSVTIPGSVTSIGDNAFSNNPLTNVIIPNSVTSIGARAFSENQLGSITIPDSVRHIGDAAFQRSSPLANQSDGFTSITIGANVVTEGNPFQYSIIQTGNSGNADGGFLIYYYQNGRQGGTYTRTEGRVIYGGRHHFVWKYQGKSIRGVP
jgi:hypothetical protein